VYSGDKRKCAVQKKIIEIIKKCKKTVAIREALEIGHTQEVKYMCV
jgi:hypothetical protein